MMHDLFTTKSTAPALFSQKPALTTVSHENYSINYQSDWSDDDSDIDEDGNNADNEDQPQRTFPPPLKQRKLDVLYHVQRARKACDADIGFYCCTERHGQNDSVQENQICIWSPWSSSLSSSCNP